MKNLLQDLEEIAKGKGEALRNKKTYRKTWKYRFGETVVREERKKMFRTLGAVLISGVISGAGATPHIESWLEKRERERIMAEYAIEYSSSPEGMARQASTLTPSSIDSFVNLISEKFKEDMNQYYLPILHSKESQAIFPEGFYTFNQSVAYQTGTNYLTGYFLDLLFSFWKLTGDSEYIEWYIDYAGHVEIDLTSTYPENSNPVVGRYAYPLEAVPEIRRKYGSELSSNDQKILDDLYEQAMTAAVLVLDEYHKDSGSFPLKARQDWPVGIRLSREDKVMPLIYAVYESSDREKILARTQTNITIKELEKIILDSGITSCQRLVREDGKSFLRAYVTEDGRTVNRWPYAISENLRSESKQPVVSQDHFALLSSVNKRIHLLSNRPEYTEKISDLEACSARLTDYAYDRFEEKIPEYLFLPKELSEKNKGLEQDALAETLFVYALAVNGKEEEFLRELSRFFSTIQMNHTPLHPFKKENRIFDNVRIGLLFGRGYHNEKRGTLNEAEALLLRSIIHFKESNLYNPQGGGGSVSCSQPLAPGVQNEAVVPESCPPEYTVAETTGEVWTAKWTAPKTENRTTPNKIKVPSLIYSPHNKISNISIRNGR